MDGGAAQVLVTEASQGPVGQWNSHTAVMNAALAGPHTFTLRWDVAPGVELFVDDVDLDFCCDSPVQVTPTFTPPPTDTPTPTPSNTPTPSLTPTNTPTPSDTPTLTPSRTPTPSPTPTRT